MAVSADNDAASMRRPSAGRLVVFGSQVFREFESVEAAGRSMEEVRFLPRPGSPDLNHYGRGGHGYDLTVATTDRFEHSAILRLLSR